MSDTRIVQPARRSIDGRRRCVPRDYLRDPYVFGELPGAEFRLPDDGDEVSLEIAKMLHICLCTLRATPGAPSGAELGRRFGFSRQTWSSITRGYRWPGHTVLVAILTGLRGATNR